MKPAQHRDEISRTVLGVLVRPDIDPDDAVCRATGQVGVDRLHPVVVEAEAIDGRPVLGQAKEPRLGVSRLRARRDRPDLGKANAGGQCLRHGGCVLVEARRDTDRVGQIDPGNRGLQSG